MLFQIDPEFTALAETKITPLTISVFLKHSNDHVLVILAQDIFKELSKVPACSAPLQQKLLPTLIEILTTSHDKIPASMPSVRFSSLVMVAIFPYLQLHLIASNCVNHNNRFHLRYRSPWTSSQLWCAIHRRLFRTSSLHKHFPPV